MGIFFFVFISVIFTNFFWLLELVSPSSWIRCVKELVGFGFEMNGNSTMYSYSIESSVILISILQCYDAIALSAMFVVHCRLRRYD